MNAVVNVSAAVSAAEGPCEGKTGPLKLACDLNPVNVAKGGVEAGKSAAEGIQEVGDFASNPLGYLAEKAQSGAHSLATDLLPVINGALHPDLSAPWFLSAYKISFALAIFAWVVHLLWSFVRYSQSRISSAEMAEVVTTRMALFFGGAIFGPAFGVLLTKFFAAMTDPIAAWAVSGAMAGTPKASEGTAHALGELIASGKTDEMVGGEFLALLIFICMIVGLLMTIMTLAIVVVTFYLTGIVFPLGWSWITSARHHHRAMQLVSVWVGLLMTPPLLYLLLGGALRMAGGNLLNGEVPGLDKETPEGVRLVVGLVIAVIALWIVGTAPFTLLKFAPVLPGGSASGISRPTPRTGGGGFAGSGGGSGSGSSSGMAQAASDGYLDTGSAGGTGAASAGGGDALSAVADSMSGQGAGSGSGDKKQEAAMAAATVAGPEAALAAEAGAKAKGVGDKAQDMATGAADQASSAAGGTGSQPESSSSPTVGSSGGGADVAATVSSTTAGSAGAVTSSGGGASRSGGGSQGGGSSIVEGLSGAAAAVDQTIAPLADTAAQQVDDHRSAPPPRSTHPHHDGRGDD